MRIVGGGDLSLQMLSEKFYFSIPSQNKRKIVVPLPRDVKNCI
jgi:hypothetical protein